MTTAKAIERLREVARLKHVALSTEQAYAGWLCRFMGAVAAMPAGWSSERKIEQFLTDLARGGVAASTQNQAFNAILFFYRHCLGRELAGINALRARQPVRIRHAPSVQEVRDLLAMVRDVQGYPTRLLVHLLYGCGLRVTEPLNLRIKDVDLTESRVVVRSGKGDKDRLVPIPCCLVEDLKAQMRAARVVWEQDGRNQVPVKLPGHLAKKYPAWQFAWRWAWVFPSRTVCRDPRGGGIVRWRCHEANVQLAVKEAARRLDLAITPHVLRHAYATHALRQGADIRDLQDALGHKSVQTTMVYLTPRACAVRSPLEVLP